MRLPGARAGRTRPDGLVPLEEALEALGRQWLLSDTQEDVPLDQVVGTAGRAGDFDARWRLTNRHLSARRDRVAAALRAGHELEPVQMIRLGRLYFVVDGHHRVSVATSLGRVSVVASVRQICTTAFGMCCLRRQHLPQKAAERAFLERVPLSDQAREQLWLDDPTQWRHLADAAEAWGFRWVLDGTGLQTREELAATWWAEEVAPAVQRIRATGEGVGLRDIQLYAQATQVAADRRGR